MGRLHETVRLFYIHTVYFKTLNLFHETVRSYYIIFIIFRIIRMMILVFKNTFYP